MPQVSVIIPVYNGDRFIQQTIRSVLSQTFSDLEVIVVNDGSSDTTAEIVSKFHAPVSLYHQENHGVAQARNVGVAHAQGEWVAFLDADDVWYPEKLGIQLEYARGCPDAAFLYCDIDVINEDGQVVRRAVLAEKLERRRRRNRRSLASMAFNGLPFPYPSTVLMRKTLFVEIGGFDTNFQGNYHEDFDFFARVSKVFGMHFMTQSLVQYRVHQISNREAKNDCHRKENWSVLLNSLWDLWRDEPEKQACLLRYYAKSFSERGRYHLLSGDTQKAKNFFRLARSYRPFYWNNWGRTLIAYLPGARKIYGAGGEHVGSKRDGR